jgi:AmiR/NasT family two-component response regulator
VATRGFYIDVTEAIEAELQDAVGEELRGIVAHREVIEQAKGMRMVLYGIEADAAFAVLRWRLKELNVKLHTIAAKLVENLPRQLQLAPDGRKGADHYLMTSEVDS